LGTKRLKDTAEARRADAEDRLTQMLNRLNERDEYESDEGGEELPLQTREGLIEAFQTIASGDPDEVEGDDRADILYSRALLTDLGLSWGL
jgi:hypothetical protein